MPLVQGLVNKTVTVQSGCLAVSLLIEHTLLISEDHGSLIATELRVRL